MMTEKLWARFSETGATKGVVAETFLFPTDPNPLFLPEWVWIEAPAGTVQQSTFDGMRWTHPDLAPGGEPAEPPAPEPTYRTALTPSEFRNAFSAFEEVALVDFANITVENEGSERRIQRRVVGVFFDRVRDPHLTTVDLADPRNLAGLDLLVAVGILTKARRDTIAKGLPVSP